MIKETHNYFRKRGIRLIPVAITRAIHVITGSFQNAFCMFTPACPKENVVSTMKPNKIEVSLCLRPLPTRLQT